MPENTKMQNLISSVMTKFQFDSKKTYQENMKLLLSVVLSETISIYELKSIYCKDKNHVQENLLNLSKDVSILDIKYIDCFHKVKDLLYFGKFDELMSLFNKMMMSIFDSVANKFQVPIGQINRRRNFV